jgi:polar amino acid transport system substrate-binding protein
MARASLRIAYGDSFPPFNWVDEKGRLRGILVDLLDEALRIRMEQPIEALAFPWARAQMLVQEGSADALCTLPTVERLRYAEASVEPVATSTYTLFTRRNHPQLDKMRAAKTLDDLKGLVLLHYQGSSWARLHLAGQKVIWTYSQDHALRMVAGGRADAFIDASEALRYTIRALQLQGQLTELPQVFDTQAFHLLIRKSPLAGEILPRFDAVLRKMRAEGEVARVYEKYGVQPPHGSS